MAYAAYKRGFNCKGGGPGFVSKDLSDAPASKTPRGQRRAARAREYAHVHEWAKYPETKNTSYYEARNVNEGFFYCKKGSCGSYKKGGQKRTGCGATCRVLPTDGNQSAGKM